MKKLINKKRESINKMMCEEICSAALDIIRKTGFNGLTMDKIAERLGTAKGTIYYYFNNKDSLILEIANMISTPLLVKLRKLNVSDDTQKDKLAEAAKILVRHFELYHDFHFMLYEQYGHKFFEQDCMINEREEISKNIKDIISKGVNEFEFKHLKIDTAVECFIGLVMHLNINKRMKFAVNEKIDEQEINEVLELYLYGISNK